MMAVMMVLMRMCYHLLGTSQCAIDMVVDVLLAYDAKETCVPDDAKHVRTHAREDDADAILVALLDKDLKVVEACGIDKRNLAHADDANHRGLEGL